MLNQSIRSPFTQVPALLLLLLMWGCAPSTPKQESPSALQMEEGDASDWSSEPESRAMPRNSGVMSKSAPKRAQPSAPTIQSAPPQTQRESSTFSDASSDESSNRMVAYSGTMEMRSTEPKTVLDKAAHLTLASGGYVEEKHSQFAVFRIPTPHFDTVFKQFLGLGQVTSHSRRADDITEAFTDNELRISTLRLTLARLTELVNLAKKDKEKIQLLQEMKRLREELEFLEKSLTLLKNRAEYARIQVTVNPYPLAPVVLDVPLSGFEWIGTLGPFERRSRGRRLAFATPENMVMLEKGGRKKPWTAAGAGGTVVWASQLKNFPRGDTPYWKLAVESRLKDLYQGTEVTNAGDYTVLRFLAQGPNPYVYLVGLQAEKKRLHVVEAYFPGTEEEKRYGDAFRASLEAGAL